MRAKHVVAGVETFGDSHADAIWMAFTAFKIGRVIYRAVKVA